MAVRCFHWNLVFPFYVRKLNRKITTSCSEQAKEFVNDNLSEVAQAVLAAYDSGDLQAAVDGGHDTWQKWVKSVGKALKRKVPYFYFFLISFR